MNFQPERLYHLYNRTFNQTLAFPTRQNYLFFTKKLSRLQELCDILCYCLLPDHFEIMIHVPAGSPGLRRTTNGQMQVLSRRIGNLLSSYVRAYNKQQHRSGSLFQPKTKAKELAQNAIVCFKGIHDKPVRAGLVFDVLDWEFSSASEYKLNRRGLCNTPCAIKKLNLNLR